MFTEVENLSYFTQLTARPKSPNCILVFSPQLSVSLSSDLWNLSTERTGIGLCIFHSAVPFLCIWFFILSPSLRSCRCTLSFVVYCSIASVSSLLWFILRNCEISGVLRATANPYLFFLHSQFHDMSYLYGTDQIIVAFVTCWSHQRDFTNYKKNNKQFRWVLERTKINQN